MAVEDPGELLVVCDDCGDEEQMPTTAYGGDPSSFGVSDETLEEFGWVRDGSSTFCEDCKEDHA